MPKNQETGPPFISTIDSDKPIINDNYQQHLGFVLAKIYIALILLNVLSALGSLILNAIDPTKYQMASDPINRVYFVAICVVGSFSGFGLLMKKRVGLYATYLIMALIALVGVVAILNLDIVGLIQGFVALGIAGAGVRYFWRRRNYYLQWRK